MFKKLVRLIELKQIERELLKKSKQSDLLDEEVVKQSIKEVREVIDEL